MRKVRFLTPVALLVLLLGSVVPVWAWFDRTYEGYLWGSPTNGRLGYTNGTNVQAWTLGMRWNSTYYVRRDSAPRIDITADCANGKADQLSATGFVSNLPSKSFSRWNDCGNIFKYEEGEVYFDPYGILTTKTDYEADVIFAKQLSNASGEVNHTYQRSSGLDPKVCGTTCGAPNHDWLAKTVYVNYNYDHFEPPEAGWTSLSEVSGVSAPEPINAESQDTQTIAPVGAPFAILVGREGEHTRAYVEADFSRAAIGSYVQWNYAQVKAWSANPRQPVYAKVTFQMPMSMAEAQSLVNAIGLDLALVTFVGRNEAGEPYSAGTFTDGVDSPVSVGDAQAVLDEKGITLDGVMVLEGTLHQSDALQLLLDTPQVYLVDVTTDFVIREVQAAGVADLQGVVVPSPYWSLYLEWLQR
jgi:hypothetical protein